jgi:type III pantothenate kinase
MLLAADIGNTNIVTGIYDGQKLLSRFRMATDPRRTRDEYTLYLKHFLSENSIDRSSITAVAVASVVPQADFAFAHMARAWLDTEAFFIDHKVKLNIRLDYGNPAEIGADRIVDAAAAWDKYKKAVIILDFGTATTIELVSAEGRYKGGLIIPGFKLMKDSLHARTARLPEVDIQKPSAILGTNTVKSIQSGLYHLSVGGIERIIQLLKKEHAPEATVIATGGLASLVHEDLPSINAIEPDLTLSGIEIIYRLNHEKKA